MSQMSQINVEVLIYKKYTSNHNPVSAFSS